MRASAVPPTPSKAPSPPTPPGRMRRRRGLFGEARWNGASLKVLGLSALVLSPGVAGSLHAQDAVLLRYQPRRGAVVRSVSSTDMSVKMALGGLMDILATMVDSMGAARGAQGRAAGDSVRAALQQQAFDSIEVQLSLRQYLTEQVTDVQPGRFSVWRTVDSTRVRVRAQGEDWQEAPGSRVPRTSARVMLNDRYQISDFQLERRDTLTGLVRDFLRTPQGMELALPENPVAAGASWSTDIVFPFSYSEALSGEGDELPVQDAELVTRATITVDSIVVRAPDTLAYMRVSGNFLPVTITEAAETADAVTTLTGGMAGTLIWSTGWSAFVAGSTRSVLTAEVRLTAPGVERSQGMGMRFDATNRFQVRP